MASFKSVAIIGATGNVGQAVLPAVLKASIETTVITRSSSSATFPAGVKVIKTEYTLEHLTEALRGQDAVLCLISASALDLEAVIVDAAAAAGVKWFIPSEFGHDTTDEGLVSMLPVLKGKTRITAQLDSKAAQGLHWTAIVTGLFLDWGLARGIFEFDIAKRSARIWDDGNTKFLTTNTDDIATAVVTLLSDPVVREKVKNSHVHISSVNTTQNELLAELERATAATFTVTKVASSSVKESALKKLQAGDLSAILPLLQYVAWGEEGYSQWNAKAEKGNALLLTGPKRTLQDTIADIVKQSSVGGAKV